MNAVKTCVTCGQEKPLEQFYEHRGGRTKPGYRVNHCKTCLGKKSRQWAKDNPDKVKNYRHKRNLKQKYGLSLDTYQEMLQAQNNVCAICGSGQQRRRLNVDHCHATGKVRGLLCDQCNMAIGLLEDNVSLLNQAKVYLENSVS